MIKDNCWKKKEEKKLPRLGFEPGSPAWLAKFKQTNIDKQFSHPDEGLL